MKTGIVMHAASGLLLASILLVAGCPSDDGEEIDTRLFHIELLNLTANQPMSPPVALLDDDDWWRDGEVASTAMERMAESGDPSELIAGEDRAAQADDLLLPGQRVDLIVEGDENGLRLQVATMLVNSNDAFSGTSGEDLSSLDPGEQRVLWLPARDAGTEVNSELAETIPGPAGGGEGFNATRDDVTGMVTLHPGVVGREAGAADSALDASHRFDNPVLRVTITAL
ncbi:MAG TPA: hypothetical protein ENK54_01765 [Thiotrichales bacterium]|nr:hypothetical protein [Thiotrichales bacterium]